jgi:DegV family protein with EDD domain
MTPKNYLQKINFLGWLPIYTVRGDIYMNNIKIFTDSTSDLTKALIAKYDISVIPLYVNFDSLSLKDGVEITTEELYLRVEQTNKLPLTSAPSPADFIAAFKPFIENGQDIIYIGLSSQLSSTIQNAHIAAKDFPDGRIEIVDSLNVCLGIGVLALKAYEFAEKGTELKEIGNKLRALVPKLRVTFIIDTLDYLHKGGRCSALQSFVGGIFKIRPLVKMEDGKIILWDKLRGKREKCVQTLLERALSDKGNIDPSSVFVAHSSAEEDALFVKTQLEKELSINNILICNAGCVISSHCGPNTVGIIYILK